MSPSATFSQEISAQGPLLQIAIAPPDAVMPALRAANQPVPAVLSGTALIDTGATVTVIAPDAARKLRLNPLDASNVKMANGQVLMCGRHLVKVVLPHPLPAVTVVAAAIPGLDSDCLCLLGRDMLHKGTFCYHGTDNYFTLSL